MARTTISALAAAMLLLAADATVRTTVIINEEPDSPSAAATATSSCPAAEMQKKPKSMLSRCQTYVMDKVMSGGGGNVGDEHLNECCGQLRQMGSGECTCMCLQMAMEQMMKGMMTTMEEEYSAAIWDMAEKLPGKCGMSSPSRCQLGPPRAAAAAAAF